MKNIDKRDNLKSKPFSYKVTKSNITLIYYHNKQIMILSEKDTSKMLKKISGKSDYEIQLVLAKLTGNFKHGNER